MLSAKSHGDQEVSQQVIDASSVAIEADEDEDDDTFFQDIELLQVVCLGRLARDMTAGQGSFIV